MNKEKKKPLVPYSIRLTEDQIVFLRGIKDASSFLRQTLDKEILTCSTKENPKLALNRRVVELQDRIKRIKESKEYGETMERWNVSGIAELKKQIERLNQLRLLDQAASARNLKTEVHGPSSFAKYGMEVKLRQYKVYCPGNPEICVMVEASAPDEALQEAKRRIGAEMASIESYIKGNPGIVKEYEYLKKIKESYEEAIKILEKEIEETKSKIIAT